MNRTHTHKNNLYHTYSFWLLIILFATSCKKLIEIPSNPPTAITEEQQFEDSATTMTAMAGIYSYPSNGSGGFVFNNSYQTLLTALSSDELSMTDPFFADMYAFYSSSVTPFNSLVNDLWSNPYRGLYPVNAALQGIAASKGLSASLKTQLTAELKTVRALYYFYLVNDFGGVPLVTGTDYKVTATLPRASVDEIYGQINKDLDDAINVLPVDYPSDGRTRPNLYTALALRARVDLYREKWQDAYDAASDIINSGFYTLDDDLNVVFLEGSQEAIWQLPANGMSMVTAEASRFVPWAPDIIPSFLLTPSLQNAFEPGDKRFTDWVGMNIVNIDGTDQQYLYPAKYKNVVVESPTVENYMIFRLAEVLLIRAEAAAHLEKVDEGLTDINTVRTRAGLPDAAANTKEELLDAVMKERRTELFCEWGNRWFDLRRTGLIDNVLGAEKEGWKSYQALYPISVIQLQANSFLEQNPGYH